MPLIAMSLLPLADELMRKKTINGLGDVPPAAPAQNTDVAKIFQAIGAATPQVVAALQKPVQPPAPPKPKHGALVWAAIGVGAVVIGGLIYRSTKKPSALAANPRRRK
jgi:hypothetical protein